MLVARAPAPLAEETMRFTEPFSEGVGPEPDEPPDRSGDSHGEEEQAGKKAQKRKAVVREGPEPIP